MCSTGGAACSTQWCVMLSAVRFVFDTTTLRFLYHLDVAANQTVTGRRRTISAELGSRIVDGTASDWDRTLCAALDRFEPYHCVRSYERSLSG